MEIEIETLECDTYSLESEPTTAALAISSGAHKIMNVYVFLIKNTLL